jgi:hypothetical protein
VWLKARGPSRASRTRSRGGGRSCLHQSPSSRTVTTASYGGSAEKGSARLKSSNPTAASLRLFFSLQSGVKIPSCNPTPPSLPPPACVSRLRCGWVLSSRSVTVTSPNAHLAAPFSILRCVYRGSATLASHFCRPSRVRPTTLPVGFSLSSPSFHRRVLPSSQTLLYHGTKPSPARQVSLSLTHAQTEPGCAAAPASGSPLRIGECLSQPSDPRATKPQFTCHLQRAHLARRAHSVLQQCLLLYSASVQGSSVEGTERERWNARAAAAGSRSFSYWRCCSCSVPARAKAAAATTTAPPPRPRRPWRRRRGGPCSPPSRASSARGGTAPRSTPTPAAGPLSRCVPAGEDHRTCK